jgi:pimeloyl-ACP methyl ester carboxylesterase
MSGTFEDFLRLSPEDGLAFVRESDANADVVSKGLGESAFAEFIALAGTAPEAAHLGITQDTNLLFLPGIMGSSLGSDQLGGIWWLDLSNTKAVNKLGLSADGTADAQPGAEIVPLTTDHRYSAFLAACRDESGFVHDRLPYDWRKSLRLSSDAVRDRIIAIQEKNGGEPVHVVAHSMGGVLIRVALMVHEELWSRVGKIAFIGTPHYGAPAIGGYLKNHFWGFNAMVVLAELLERTTFRSMRGALGLLPAPIGVYPGTRHGEEHPCANFDLYDVSAWHLDLDSGETARLRATLDDAAKLHKDLYDAHQRPHQDRRDRMLVIAGVGYKTLFRLEYRKRLFLWEHMAKITDQDPNDANRLGDGRVPLASAALENVGEIRYVRGVHGGLPNIPAVYRDVFRWFKDEPLKLPTSPAGALARHLAMDETVSQTPTLDGSSIATDDDPGYLDLDPVSEERTAELVEEVEAGHWPEFRSVSIL